MRNSWKTLLIKNLDRLIFSTEVHKKIGGKISKNSKINRDILNQLSEAVNKKIAYFNAEKIYGLKFN